MSFSNSAIIDLVESIINVRGLLEEVKLPFQLLNMYSGLGVAVIVTLWPAGWVPEVIEVVPVPLGVTETYKS